MYKVCSLGYYNGYYETIEFEQGYMRNEFFL